MLSKKDQQELLALALQSIDRCLGREQVTREAGTATEPADGTDRREFRNGGYHQPLYRRSLCTRCGVFVSLYVNGMLRGCIGTFSESEPLYRNVIEMAVCAATNDSRFPPIRKEEIGDLEIEISVLSPRRRVSGAEEIIPGKHGIYIKKGSCRGTLLPQVATEQGWNAEELLQNCSRYKAGIGWDGWKTAELFVYEATVISSRKCREDVNFS